MWLTILDNQKWFTILDNQNSTEMRLAMWSTIFDNQEWFTILDNQKWLLVKSAPFSVKSAPFFSCPKVVNSAPFFLSNLHLFSL